MEKFVKYKQQKSRAVAELKAIPKSLCNLITFCQIKSHLHVEIIPAHVSDHAYYLVSFRLQVTIIKISRYIY